MRVIVDWQCRLMSRGSLLFTLWQSLCAAMLLLCWTAASVANENSNDVYRYLSYLTCWAWTTSGSMPAESSASKTVSQYTPVASITVALT